MSKTFYELPPLPYGYDELEPVISKEIMELHHKKHHQAYVNNLNAALEKYVKAEESKNIEEMVALQSAIRFNGGGHINHSIFWAHLAPIKKGGGGKPQGELAHLLEKTFGSFEQFVEKFSAAAVAIQGSGWAWLGYEKASGKLVIDACANQDPLSTKGLVALMGFDVWEHAYYLQYKNVRADYVKALWQVIYWKNVEERFLKAKT